MKYYDKLAGSLGKDKDIEAQKMGGGGGGVGVVGGGWGAGGGGSGVGGGGGCSIIYAFSGSPKKYTSRRHTPGKAANTGTDPDAYRPINWPRLFKNVENVATG